MKPSRKKKKKTLTGKDKKDRKRNKEADKDVPQTKMIMKTATNLWTTIVMPRPASTITRHLYQAADDGDDSERDKTQLRMNDSGGGDL